MDNVTMLFLCLALGIPGATVAREVGEVDADRVFQGSIPALYDKHLGPLIFVPYADDLASRLADIQHGRILETAAGTGVLTRALVSALPESVSIVATDLNQPMLDHASTQAPSTRVNWRKADAQQLPFPDGEFDAVVCQFGVMFSPGQAAGFLRSLSRAEARWTLPVQCLGPD
jgi:Methyltransferase domain